MSAAQRDEDELDPIFERISTIGAAYYADPFRHRPDDPDRHFMEVITQPYGETPEG